jgi:hydrogenase-4 component B
MTIFFIAILLTGLILTVCAYRNKRLSALTAVLTLFILSCIVLAVSLSVFITGIPFTESKIFSLPSQFGAELNIRLDRLSALFAMLIAVVTLLAGVYSIKYMDIYEEEKPIRFYPFLILFFAGMIGVVSVSDLFFFLVFWEFMTLTSYFLVIFEKDEPQVLKAGFKYFLMTHIGTAFMIIASLMLQAHAGSFSFDAIAAAMAKLSAENPLTLNIILAMFFLGFATKAGVFPFGTWLPDAHPAAPSGVSAILSGVMIKIGIFGMLRVFLFMLPLSGITSGWGIAIASFGTLSIIMGNTGALLQDDYKRLFAFSSIGQIGYIMLAFGLSPLLSRPSRMVVVISSYTL